MSQQPPCSETVKMVIKSNNQSTTAGPTQHMPSIGEQMSQLPRVVHSYQMQPFYNNYTIILYLFYLMFILNTYDVLMSMTLSDMRYFKPMIISVFFNNLILFIKFIIYW